MVVVLVAVHDDDNKMEMMVMKAVHIAISLFCFILLSIFFVNITLSCAINSVQSI